MSTETSQTPHSDAWFAPTRWTLVLSARAKGALHSEEALEWLCRTYWPPLYAYVRRQGHSPADAQDLTQEFFARLLQKDYLRAVAPEKGKFRTFLLMALKRFLCDEWDKASAKKRGGGQAPFSLDTAVAENLFQNQSAEGLSPDKLYERQWALTLIDRAVARLRQEFTKAGKAQDFDCLKVFLTADKGTIAYSEVAAKLGVSEGAARVAVHRLRQQFRRVFRQEIAQTVSSPEEIDQEVHYLMSVLGD